MKKYIGLCILTVSLAWLPWFLGAWDKDIPTASTSLRTSNPQLLANFAAIETALDQDHDFTSGSTQTGKHNKLTLMELSGDPTIAANEMGFYCKDLGTAPGIYVRPQSNGTAVQWTGIDAKIRSLATDMLDEDDMASDDPNKTASQQSIKAYMDSGTVTMTNKTLTSPTLTSPVFNTAASGTAVLDEDDMASDSATQLATQQSIKKYVDDQIAGIQDPAYSGGESHTFDGGLIMKMGYISSGGTQTVTFGSAFPNDIISVVYSIKRAAGGTANAAVISAASTSAFTINSPAGADGYYWQAIGY